MKLITKRKQLYGGPLVRGKRFTYSSTLNGDEIATGDTKEAAEELAYQRLQIAFDHIEGSCAVRTAKDGTIIVVRPLSKTEAMVEHCRGGRSGGCSFGQMTMYKGGVLAEMAKDVHEYADYTLAQYDPVSPAVTA